MGYGERSNQIQASALRADYENRVGRLLDFGAHAGGCPACGTAEFKLIYCTGSRKLIQLPADACPVEGEHLHVFCARCNHEHLTRLKSDPGNPVREPGTGALMDSFARAALCAVLESLGGSAVTTVGAVKGFVENADRVLVTQAGEDLELALPAGLVQAGPPDTPPAP